MKVSRLQSEWRPVRITLESHGEYQCLRAIALEYLIRCPVKDFGNAATNKFATDLLDEISCLDDINS